MKNIILTLASVALLAGCGAKSDVQQTANAQPAQGANKGAIIQPQNMASQQQQAATNTDPAAPAAASESASKITGRIVETYDAAGYTYVKLDTGAAEQQWAAVAQTKVKKGQSITINAQMTVDDFESKTLNRKFKKIIFGTVDGGNAPAAQTASQQMPAGHPNVAGMGGAMPPGMASAMGTPQQHMSGGADAGDVSVPKAEGANAMTVAQVWNAKPGDKPVVIRGKVVKFLSGIMGRNWLHIRDGSGSAEKGDHDLTVTTSEMVTVGDVVIVSGVVRVDKDFGAGYRYPVIVEEGKISK